MNIACSLGSSVALSHGAASLSHDVTSHVDCIVLSIIVVPTGSNALHLADVDAFGILCCTLADLTASVVVWAYIGVPSTPLLIPVNVFPLIPVNSINSAPIQILLGLFSLTTPVSYTHLRAHET